MLKSMTIGNKLITIFLTIIVLMLGFAWFSVTQLSNMYHDTAKITNNVIPSIRASSQMHTALLDARRAECSIYPAMLELASRRLIMTQSQIYIYGIDLGKNWFHLVAMDFCR